MDIGRQGPITQGFFDSLLIPVHRPLPHVRTITHMMTEVHSLHPKQPLMSVLRVEFHLRARNSGRVHLERTLALQYFSTLLTLNGIAAMPMQAGIASVLCPHN